MARVRSRIMVVGRDVAQRARLARLLNGAGYRVELGEDALHARRIGFDGIALAIVAPGGLGPEASGLIRELRAVIGHVLVVGGSDDRATNVLDASDEDKLLARVAEALALAPRPEADLLEPVLQFGGYWLDPGGQTLREQTGKEIPLTHGEFRLLRVFVQRPGRVLSRDQLLQLLSGRDAEVYDRSIDMQVVRLRRKIESDPKRPTLIVTVPNSGYKFAATVRQAEAAALVEVAPPEIAAGNAERRHVTALAAEVLAGEGTTLPDDPEELRSIIDAWRRYATAVIARHDGMLLASRVRETLAYFGYPVAQEHAAERALHAALALTRQLAEGQQTLPAGLAVRVGVASGLVVAEFDWRGAWRDSDGGHADAGSCRAWSGDRRRNHATTGRGAIRLSRPWSARGAGLSQSSAGLGGGWRRRPCQPLRGIVCGGGDAAGGSRRGTESISAGVAAGIVR